MTEEERKQARTKEGNVEYLGLESVTLVPYQRCLINTKRLMQNEKDWLNSFNIRCRKCLIPFLTKEEKDWLMKETEPY